MKDLAKVTGSKHEPECWGWPGCLGCKCYDDAAEPPKELDVSKFKVGYRVRCLPEYVGDTLIGDGTVTYLDGDYVGVDLDEEVEETSDVLTQKKCVRHLANCVVVDPLAVTQPAVADDYHAKKFDKGKCRLDLIPAECLEGIGGVLTYGVEKYDEDSWMQVPDAEKRYFRALFRHLLEIKKHGFRALDPESGKLHIDHVATNAAFLQYFARKP